MARVGEWGLLFYVRRFYLSVLILYSEKKKFSVIIFSDWILITRLKTIFSRCSNFEDFYQSIKQFSQPRVVSSHIIPRISLHVISLVCEKGALSRMFIRLICQSCRHNKLAKLYLSCTRHEKKTPSLAFCTTRKKQKIAPFRARVIKKGNEFFLSPSLLGDE